jgi:Zn-dependent protease
VFAGGSITLFRVRGVRIGVDYSWFFVLFLVIIWLSTYYRGILDVSSGSLGPYALAVASALLFFTSIVLHELGHAFIANRNGVPITQINLWMFGGVARMTRDSDSAGTEFKIAIAGPLVTMVIVIVTALVGIGFAGANDFWQAMRVEQSAHVSGALALIAWLTSINALVLCFNLIPAFPLDGGRIARAIAWWRTGDRTSATRFAARLGQAFAYLFIGVGIYLVFFANDPIGGIWLALIGFILSQSARAASVQTALTSKIEGISVRDVMDREPVAIPQDLSIEQALDQYFLRYHWPWFPVVDTAHHFRGLLQRATADSVPEVERASARVAELTDTARERAMRISEDAPLETLLSNETLRSLGALMAVDAEGRLRGVITIEQVGRAVKSALSG